MGYSQRAENNCTISPTSRTHTLPKTSGGAGGEPDPENRGGARAVAVERGAVISNNRKPSPPPSDLTDTHSQISGCAGAPPPFLKNGGGKGSGLVGVEGSERTERRPHHPQVHRQNSKHSRSPRTRTEDRYLDKSERKRELKKESERRPGTKTNERPMSELNRGTNVVSWRTTKVTEKWKHNMVCWRTWYCV